MPDSRLHLVYPITHAAQLDSPQRRLDTVAGLARDLAGRFELQPLLERILRHAVTLLGCESGSISLVNEAKGTYSKKVDFGVGCQEGQTFPLREGVTGQVVRTRSTVMLRTYSDVTGGHIAPDDPRWGCAVIGVPIQWDDRVIGTCIIFAADPHREFTHDDARLADLFASQAAIALRNSELHTEAFERAREAAVAAERERAVRDVHEAIGRSLAGLLLALDDAERTVRDLDVTGHRTDNAATRQIGTARTIAYDALTETRRTVLGMEPASLAGRDLDTAVADELAWVESVCATRAEVTIMGAPRPLAPEITHQAFKIIQEALGNVATHSHATTVRVGLRYEPEALAVLVEDNGCGFDPTTVRGRNSAMPSVCLGLQGMRSRAVHLGGELTIDSLPGWGTTIRASLPNTVPSQPGHATSRWKVLIATDRPLIGAGLVRLLHLSEPAVQIDAEVSTAGQLRDAYALLRPDVLVADLKMVERDMAERAAPSALAEIRALDPSAALVVLADHPTPAQVLLAKDAGVRGFISQSASGETIARVIVAAGQGEALVEGDLFDELLVPAEPAAAPDSFTARERQVRDKVLQGLADKQIARELQISVKTVEKHVGSLLRKTGARNRTMLVSMDHADQHGAGSTPRTPASQSRRDR